MTAAVMEATYQPFTLDLFDAFVDWIDRGKQTTKTYLAHLKQFFVWTRYKAIVQPIKEDIAAFRDWLLSEHEAIQIDADAAEGWSYRTDNNGKRISLSCTPNTARQYLRSLKQFFKWAENAGVYPNIADGVRPPKVKYTTHRRDALTVEQVKTVESSIKENSRESILAAGQERKDTQGRTQRKTEQGARLLAMYELAVTVGLRTIEISRARVKDFEERNGRYFLYIQGKGHAEADERKPLAPEVAEAVKEYLDIRRAGTADGLSLNGNSPLFVATGNRHGGGRLEARTIGSMIKDALKTAGLNSKRISAHSLRHTAGTLLYEMTGDLYAVQKYMRHEKPSTTEVYIHADMEEKEAEYARMLYDLYHNEGQAKSKRERLSEILDRLPKEKIETLANIAEAMT